MKRSLHGLIPLSERDASRGGSTQLRTFLCGLMDSDGIARHVAWEAVKNLRWMVLKRVPVRIGFKNEVRAQIVTKTRDPARRCGCIAMSSRDQSFVEQALGTGLQAVSEGAALPIFGRLNMPSLQGALRLRVA